ncbi:siderophore-iron reductase FhuF [Methylobacterium sp. JK268]
MIADIAAELPPSLTTFGNRIAVTDDLPERHRVARLRERPVFDGVIDAFAAGYPEADRRSLVSLWSQSYLAALIIPCVTALVRLDRVLPVALDETGFVLDGTHALARFLVAEPGRRDGAAGRGFATLVAGHLQPFVALCAGHAGLAPRVLWGNAGVMLDVTVRELAAAGPLLPAPRAEAETLLGWRAGAASPTSPLAQTFRARGACAERCRRVCCLRCRIPGVASCGALCPLDACRRTSC